MRIKKKISQHRRDFSAIYVCESCGKEREGEGYDDRNFHVNVIPDMICEECGEKSPKEYQPLGTKYLSGATV